MSDIVKKGFFRRCIYRATEHICWNSIFSSWSSSWNRG